MAPNYVVKNLDVIEQISLGLFSEVVDPPINALSLEMSKETLDQGVIVTVSPAA